MPYILDPMFVGQPGGGIVGKPPWNEYLNPWPGAHAKWVGKAALIQPLDQYVILNPTCLPGGFQNLYYSLISQLSNWEFIVKKVDEWIEISPIHKGYYDLVFGEKERLEIKLKTVIDDVIKHVSDLELLEHDYRRYKEFLDYFENNDEHSLKAVFIDLVDFHAGEGAPGRLSMSFMQQNNIFPTIIQDFYEIESEEDIEKKDRLKRLPKVEKDMLKTKWKAYQEWKNLFGHEVKTRCERLQQLIESKKRLIEQTKEWIKPYIARHKLLEEGLSRAGVRKAKPVHEWHISAEPTSEEVVVLWAWKQFEPEEFYKIPGEIMALREIRPDDEWTRKHLIFHEELGLKQKYPWITEGWVNQKIKEIMEVDDWFFTKRRTPRKYLYYTFLEIEFDKRTLRSPTGSEIEDIDITVRNYWMSQNVLLVKLLELKAKQEELEHYIDELLGLRAKTEFENIKEEIKNLKLKDKILYLKKNRPDFSDENIREILISLGEKISVDEIRKYNISKRNYIEKIEDFWNRFTDFFGIRFAFMKKGPYERDFENRITKFHLTGVGREAYGPVVRFLKSKMMV